VVDIPTRSKRPVRALLVDDDPDMRVGHARRLEADGYEVTQARDLESGLSFARNSRPEIIFLHLGKAGSGGVAFLQKLRADDTMRHIPVSMLSNHSNLRLKKLGLNSVSGDGW
jgi:DNA-binding response OmpR family regulator